MPGSGARPVVAQPAVSRREGPGTRAGKASAPAARHAARKPDRSDAGAAFVERVRTALRDHQLIRSGSRVVVAVSGGADSIVLLDVLHRLAGPLSLQLCVVHVDHQLRLASREDAEFVEHYAARKGLPAIIERRDVGRLAASSGMSLEEAGRIARYEALAQAAERLSAPFVATAHTADDQAETVLLRLVRGTGLLGLRAMAWRRPLRDGLTLVRPLLGAWRDDVTAYLQARGLSCREDQSNADVRFTRNRIRHELLPTLAREYNPQIKQALVQLAEASALEYAVLETALGRVWRRLVKPEGPGRLTLNTKLFSGLAPALQQLAVRRAVQQVKGDLRRLEYRHWSEVSELFGRRPVGTEVSLPAGVRFTRRHGDVLCEVAARGVESRIAEV